MTVRNLSMTARNRSMTARGRPGRTAVVRFGVDGPTADRTRDGETNAFVWGVKAWR
ncbi:hypothetical protein [Natrarchaeobius chitinivorans]|uniref:hypothetical protein n=1 Tax=Natrarchaeobius chitinivorans TaxID=1679083 RepID=UPI001404350D|nr:hypothetical protein [Natrarchaeobius chitinivorans]